MENEEKKEKIKFFTDLNAWKEGHKLVLLVYKLTKKFPAEEKFALSNQIKRAVVSITSNITEGFSRNSYREKLQFYSVALGSITETQNQLFVSKDVQYTSQNEFEEIMEQTTKVHKITNGLIKNCKNIIYNPQKK